MNNFAEFQSRGDLNARANLTEFIRVAKDELQAFGGRLAWGDMRWSHGETVVVFSSLGATGKGRDITPIADPFINFAKAYVRYQFSRKPVKGVAPMIRALKCIEAGLLSVRGRADILLLNGAVMDVCVDKCRKYYPASSTRFSTGTHLMAILNFVRSNFIVPGMPVWRSPFKLARSLSVRLGAEGDQHRSSKLPSNEAVLAAADLFAHADDVEEKFYSSIVALLIAAPSRISEVLNLPVNCIQWEPDAKGEQQMFLRWRAGKGKGEMKKWIIPPMRDVVVEAVRRLSEIGAPAREAARFAYRNPGKFMGHVGCLVDPNVASDRALMPDEFCAAVGVKCPGGGRLKDGSTSWVRISVGKRLQSLISNGRTRYSDLAEHVLDAYGGRHWPFIDEGGLVAAWDALCLHRHNEFHKVYEVKGFSWRIPDPVEVIVRFKPDMGMSLLDRRELRGADGQSVKLSTHQFRHWLSTMSERAGMDEYTLAQWAGRARVTDNCNYDHRSPEERIESAKAILQLERPSLLERFKDRRPISHQELGVDRLGAAKATLYGMCVHDYAMAPCQKQAECMTCSEQVCIKGDHVTLERIKNLERQTQMLLERAQQAHEQGDFGADRWVDSHKWKLAHVRSMRVALEHSDTPDGALLRIPVGHDPSPVRRVLMELRMEASPALKVASDSDLVVIG